MRIEKKDQESIRTLTRDLPSCSYQAKDPTLPFCMAKIKGIVKDFTL